MIATTADRYRAMYPDHAITPSTALLGAREAVEAVRALGGRALVVTAKYGPNAKLHLAHLGIEPDVLIGGLWAEGKGRRSWSTARTSTSVTTPGTCAGHASRTPCRSESPQGRATRTNCGRPAPT